MSNSLRGCLRATLMIVSDSKHFSEDSLFCLSVLPPALSPTKGRLKRRLRMPSILQSLFILGSSDLCVDRLQYQIFADQKSILCPPPTTSSSNSGSWRPTAAP